MKKIYSFILATALFFSSVNYALADGMNAYIYTADGRVASVPENQVEAYKKVGWYVANNNLVTIFATDGRSSSVPAREVGAYLNVGWHIAPDNCVAIYTWDGRTANVSVDEFTVYTNLGWNVAYEGKAKIYAPGKEASVPLNQISAYAKVGWYLYPVITMYAPDGRSTVVATSEVENYKNVGWSESQAAYSFANTNNIAYDSSVCGSVTGTITYQYNRFIGTRADVGANILLIQVNHVPTERDALNVFSSDNNDPAMHYTKADGMGNYYLDNIPAGDYYLLVLSSKTNQSPRKQMDNCQSVESCLRGKISDEALDYIKALIGGWSFKLQRIQVKQNQIYRYSYDWGYTYM